MRIIREERCARIPARKEDSRDVRFGEEEADEKGGEEE